nr:MAG TPA: hypothetical protein [Caudoviricetes sp.]
MSSPKPENSAFACSFTSRSILICVGTVAIMKHHLLFHYRRFGLQRKAKDKM